MSKQLYTVSKEGLEYLCGLINKIITLPSDVIDNLNLADNTTFSSTKINALINQTLLDANTHSEELCNALTKLTCEKTTTQPTLDNSKINVIYLYSSDGNAPFEQYLKISDTELIDMGSTSVSLNDYLTATQIASTYAKQIDLDTLITEVTNIKSDFTTHKTKWNEVDNKVDKTDIVDNLTSTDTDKPLSANQGRLLNSMVLIPGIVLPYAGSSVPAGFLLCNGQAVSRTTYQDLFDVIGTTYGEGDGSTTFNLPNLQDKFIEGAGTNAVGTEMSAGLPNITGEFHVYTYNPSYGTGAFTKTIDNPNASMVIENKTGNSFSSINLNASKSSPIYGNSTTVQPPSVVMNYIIKY